MWRKKSVLLLLTVIILSGCSFNSRTLLESVEYTGKIYKTGFYGDLWPNDIKLDMKQIKFGKIIGYKVKDDNLDWLLLENGDKIPGAVYCPEAEYYDALEYYSKQDNYGYYLSFGSKTDERHRIEYNVTNMDYDMFDDLDKFSMEHNYSIYAPDKDNGQKPFPVSDPDHLYKDEINIYKISKDSMFSSCIFTYQIIDNKLIGVYNYDCSEGNECLNGIEVPEEMSDYFCDLISQYPVDKDEL